MQVNEKKKQKKKKKKKKTKKTKKKKKKKKNHARELGVVDVVRVGGVPRGVVFPPLAGVVVDFVSKRMPGVAGCMDGQSSDSVIN